MRKLCSAMALLAGMSLLGACQSLPYDSQRAYEQQLSAKPKPGSKEAEIELLQKATALAQGELAWETVQVSDIQRDATSVKWVATTRSLHVHCTAYPDGSGSYCL
jgi:hypothetical protein